MIPRAPGSPKAAFCLSPSHTIVVAQLEGRCSNCDGRIAIGQRIEKTNAGWMHEDCPADPPDDNWL